MNTIGKLASLGLLSLALNSYAQPAPSAIQEFEQNRRLQEQQAITPLLPGQTAPELYPGENEDVGPQRILRVKPQRKYVEAAVDSQYFYTSNILLTDHGTDSALFINTIHLALAPDPFPWQGGQLAPRLGFRNQWYNYGLDGHHNNFGAFDFDAQTVFGEVAYQFLGKWQALISLDATRLLDQHSYNQFYQELAPGWGLQRLFPITDRQLVALSYRGYYHFTDVHPPSPRTANNRYDHIFTALYSLQIVPRLVLQPFYSFQFTGYTGDLGGRSRDDTFHTVGTTLGYWFNSWAGVRTFVNYSVKQSDHPIAPDYRKLDAGGGLSLVFRF